MQTPPQEQVSENESQLPTMLQQELLCRAETRLDGLLSRITVLMLANARTYTETRHFSTNDVRMMLRGQILRPNGSYPVCASASVVPERSVYQLHVMPPDRPTSAACNDLYCPLHERYLRGEVYIPCADLYEYMARDKLPFDRLWPAPTTDAERAEQQVVRDIVKGGNSPCEALGELAMRITTWLSDDVAVQINPFTPLIGTSESETVTSPPAFPPLYEHGQSLLKAHLDPADGQHATAFLHYLLLTRRIYTRELWLLVEIQILITDPDWLPCRDDQRRVHFFPRTDPLDPIGCGEDDEGLNMLPELRCPLEVRGLQGDRTVPCVEALSKRPDPTFIAAETLFRKRGLHPGGPAKAPLCDEAGTPLPVSWREPDEQPGGPRDPVRLLKMRPCYLLGRMLYFALPAWLDLLSKTDGSPPG